MPETSLQAVQPYEVYAIRYASQDRRAESHMYMGGDPNKMVPGLDFFTWVIVGNGRKWVIDTGYHKAVGDKMGHHLLMPPVAALSNLGVDAKTVSDVIITHCHYDHVGNLDAYPQARFHLQDEEMIAMTGRDVTHPLLKTYGRRNTLTMVGLNYDGRIAFHHGDTKFAPGIEFMLIGGHSRGQMVIKVWTKRGWIYLASDAIHLYEEMEQERPFAVFWDLKQMLEGYRRVRHEAASRDHVIPGHDPEVAKRFPPPSANLEGVVMALHEEPRPR